jgi:vacuolar protein sorting-associated protein 13A/C
VSEANSSIPRCGGVVPRRKHDFDLQAPGCLRHRVGTSRNPFFFFLNAIIMTLGNVDRAPVQLNALLVHNARVSMDSLTQRVILHYSEQLKAQLYSVIGSADFLGNPVGLFNNVSSGVQDIFYEPYQGLVMHGNKELGIGIARVGG